MSFTFHYLREFVSFNLMKHFFFSIFLILLFENGFSQCSGCIINPACTITPAAPALCPDVLPNAIQGEFYDMDITFFIPQQFYNSSAGVNVTISQITITSVSGLPSGLSWTASESDNIYDITSDTLTQRGCVKICGTPNVIGSYTVSVNVIATVTSPISTTSPQTFTLPMLVLPGGGGNSGFSFDPSSGCDSIQVDFQGLITSSTQPVQYSWDFGNGNSSNEQFPPSQSYAIPDTYFVNLQTDLLNYVLQSVTFNSTGSNWCGDIEEPSIPFVGTCTGSPDIYFQFTVGSATQQSSTTDNSTSMSLTDLNYVINEPSFSISFFDEDLITAPDDLGTTVVQVNAPGTFNFTTSEGYGTYTIITQIGLSFNNTDTVIVFASPEIPQIQVSDSLVCEGDSIQLSVDTSSFYQWYLQGEQILEANGPSISTQNSGTFQVEVRNDAGCSTFSPSQTVVVANNPDEATVFFNPISNEFFCNPANDLDWIWLLDSVEIVGSSNLISFVPNQIGYYSVIVTNSLGCSVQSAPVYFTNVGLEELSSQLQFNIFPQPFRSGSLFIEGIEKPALLRIYDTTGRLLINEKLFGGKTQSISIPEISSGLYFVKINGDRNEGVRLLVVGN